jgi:hypothetical protein
LDTDPAQPGMTNDGNQCQTLEDFPLISAPINLLKLI